MAVGRHLTRSQGRRRGRRVGGLRPGPVGAAARGGPGDGLPALPPDQRAQRLLRPHPQGQAARRHGRRPRGPRAGCWRPRRPPRTTSSASWRPPPSPRCPSAGSSCSGTPRSRDAARPRSARCSGWPPTPWPRSAYRAREGLRQAYLNAHIQARPPAGCEDIVPKLGAYVRNDLSNRDRQKVEEHLEGCAALHGHRGRAGGGRVAAAHAAHPDHRRHPGRGLPGRHRSRGARAARWLVHPGRRSGSRTSGPAGQAAVVVGAVAAAGLLVVGSLAVARAVTGGNQARRRVSDAGPDRRRLGRRRLGRGRRRRRWRRGRERGHGAGGEAPPARTPRPQSPTRHRRPRIRRRRPPGRAPAAPRGSRRSRARPRLVPDTTGRRARRRRRPPPTAPVPPPTTAPPASLSVSLGERGPGLRRPRRRHPGHRRQRRGRGGGARARARVPRRRRRARRPRGARRRPVRPPTHRHHPARARCHLRRRRQPGVGLLGRRRGAAVRAAGPRLPSASTSGLIQLGLGATAACDRSPSTPTIADGTGPPVAGPPLVLTVLPAARRRQRPLRRPCRPGADGQRHRDLRPGGREVLRRRPGTTRPRAPPGQVDKSAQQIVWIDVDADPATFNSSSATLALPPGARCSRPA